MDNRRLIEMRRKDNKDSKELSSNPPSPKLKTSEITQTYHEEIPKTGIVEGYQKNKVVSKYISDYMENLRREGEDSNKNTVLQLDSSDKKEAIEGITSSLCSDENSSFDKENDFWDPSGPPDTEQVKLWKQLDSPYHYSDENSSFDKKNDFWDSSGPPQIPHQELAPQNLTDSMGRQNNLSHGNTSDSIQSLTVVPRSLDTSELGVVSESYKTNLSGDRCETRERQETDNLSRFLTDGEERMKHGHYIQDVGEKDIHVGTQKILYIPFEYGAVADAFKKMKVITPRIANISDVNYILGSYGTEKPRTYKGWKYLESIGEKPNNISKRSKRSKDLGEEIITFSN